VPECRNVLVHVNPYPGLSPEEETDAWPDVGDADHGGDAHRGTAHAMQAYGGADAGQETWPPATDSHMDRSS